MLISKQFIYLELHKTGCTHTRDILYRHCKDECEIIGKHNTYEQIPRKYREIFKERIKIANIRNPWDWYVSLWSFGCQGKGGLYTRLTNGIDIKTFVKEKLNILYPKLNPSFWANLYSDPEDKENFRIWLKYILLVNKHSIGEGFKESSISNIVGLLTYRYIKLFTFFGTEILNSLSSLTELEHHDSRNNFIDFIIRNEHINKDIISISKDIGIDSSAAKSVIKAISNKRTNSSIRNKDYKVYYDDETANLIREKEYFIIKKYNYAF